METGEEAEQESRSYRGEETKHKCGAIVQAEMLGSCKGAEIEILYYATLRHYAHSMARLSLIAHYFLLQSEQKKKETKELAISQSFIFFFSFHTF